MSRARREHRRIVAGRAVVLGFSLSLRTGLVQPYYTAIARAMQVFYRRSLTGKAQYGIIDVVNGSEWECGCRKTTGWGLPVSLALFGAQGEVTGPFSGGGHVRFL